MHFSSGESSYVKMASIGRYIARNGSVLIPTTHFAPLWTTRSANGDHSTIAFRPLTPIRNHRTSTLAFSYS